MTKSNHHSVLISFENVTLRIRDRHILPATDWQILNGRNWIVIGANGSGKTTLLRAITGHIPVVAGKIHRHHPKAQAAAIGYVSFEQQHQLIAREQSRDAARYFSGIFNDYLTAGDLISSAAGDQATADGTIAEILAALDINHLMDRPVQSLSNGECRKVLIGRAVLKSRGMLVLDEPFEGLDTGSRQTLVDAIGRLIDQGIQFILATHRSDYILPQFSDVLGLKSGLIFCQGAREKILSEHQLETIYDRTAENANLKRQAKSDYSRPKTPQPQPIIQFCDVTVQYGHHTVFKNLNWIVNQGENWAVTGPNGSGKTTLLQMITGDHPQAYANEIYLFGHRRGSGESIWDIKQRLGMVSSEFQLVYRKPIRAYDVVLSGFFDSVGVYRSASQHQHQNTQQWIERLALTALQNQRFDLLSYGERRLVLLARAMVKTPELLVLDEPCQGMDPGNRRHVRACIDTIVTQVATQVLYVSHFADEMPECITHRFDLTEHSAEPQ